jgi:hypothetical protein
MARSNIEVNRKPTKQSDPQPLNEDPKPAKKPTTKPAKQPSSEASQPAKQPTQKPAKQPSNEASRPAKQPADQPANEAVRPTRKPRTSLGAGMASTKGEAPAHASPEVARGGEGEAGGNNAALVMSATGAAVSRLVQAKIDALPRTEVRPNNMHIPSALALGLGALPRIQALRDAMSAAFVAPPFEELDNLEAYALAAAHAHARVLPEDEGETELRALLNEATLLRERMLLSAEAGVSFGVFDAKKVAAIRRGTGHLDTIQDLSALGTLFREAWPVIGSKSLVTEADVERAIELSERLLVMVGRRRQGTDGSANPREDEERRDKAFELFRRAYEECRYAVVYVRRHEGDADEIAPPLAHSRRQGRRSQADAPGGHEPEPAEPGSHEPEPVEPIDGEIDEA